MGKKDQTDKKNKNKYHEIRFCEPYTMADNKEHTVNFKVTEEFYQVLIKKPKYKFSEEANANAYIFGKKFPLPKYIYLGQHGNDGAQTGLVDVTDATEEELKAITTSDNWETNYNEYDTEWDDRKALKLVQKNISPRVLFIGCTVGGDIGAELYGHYNEEKELDSIIIDVYLLFHNEEE